MKVRRFRFRVFDAGRIPYDEDSFDLVIANHVLFYCEDIPKVCKEVKRVLTCPSFLYSIAGAATELANPVIGTSAPAPPHFAILG